MMAADYRTTRVLDAAAAAQAENPANMHLSRWQETYPYEYMLRPVEAGA